MRERKFTISLLRNNFLAPILTAQKSLQRMENHVKNYIIKRFSYRLLLPPEQPAPSMPYPTKCWVGTITADGNNVLPSDAAYVCLCSFCYQRNNKYPDMAIHWSLGSIYEAVQEKQIRMIVYKIFFKS